MKKIVSEAAGLLSMICVRWFRCGIKGVGPGVQRCWEGSPKCARFPTCSQVPMSGCTELGRKVSSLFPVQTRLCPMLFSGIYAAYRLCLEFEGWKKKKGNGSPKLVI